MKFRKANADFFVPDGEAEDKAIARTTVLGIGAHQDDLELNGYAGIHACFGKPGKRFSGITVTDGAGSARRGVYADYSDEEMKAVRLREQRKAAVVGEYGFMAQLGYSSAEVKSGDPGIAAEIADLVRRAAPETVYSHNPFDKHDTHVAVFLQTLRALRSLNKAERPKKWYGFEAWRPLSWVDDSEKVLDDVSDNPAFLNALCSVYDSQIRGSKRYDLSTVGRLQSNATGLDSHACDLADLLCYSIDMTPLLEDDSLSLERYAAGYLDRFRADVLNRLTKFGF